MARVYRGHTDIMYIHGVGQHYSVVLLQSITDTNHSLGSTMTLC